MIKYGQPLKATTISFRGEDLRTFTARVAVASLKEAAMKEGLQSLYANAEEVLEKYKDFDIVKAMKERQGKVLWVRARAIDADVVNANGDYFSEEELLADVEDQHGNKTPAYKTFEGVPIYTNHKNDDIELAKGMVVYAEWDSKEKCVYCTFFIDEEAYPEIARGIRSGYMKDVSMGCKVEHGICSVCDNKAETEAQYCEHLKKYKGKKHPKTGEKVYEKNYGLGFIELSVVGDGAFDACAVEEIYDVDDIVREADKVAMRAASVINTIRTAASMESPLDAHAKEDILDQLAITARMAQRLAQTAGQLVGGQVLADQGTNSNATVAGILQYLGIDGRSGLNILDMLNLALNFLEVSVMNLFSRKDNVDLTHVSKISKAMADLQSTMQDMIDDGIDSGGGGRQPINQGQGQAQPQQPQPPAAAGQAGDYQQVGGAGRGMGPGLEQNVPGPLHPPQVQQHAMPGVGGGLSMADKKPKKVVLWRGAREVTASAKNAHGGNASERLGNAVGALAAALNLPPQGPTSQRSADAKIQNRRNAPTPSARVSGGRMKDNIISRVANSLLNRRAAKVSVDFNFDNDEADTRVTLSTDGAIRAYASNQQVQWDPVLTDAQMAAIQNEEVTDVGHELLAEFTAYVRTAKANGAKLVTASDAARTDSDVKEHELESKRTGTDNDVKERLLKDKAGAYSQTDAVGDVRERELESKRGKGVDVGKVREEELGHDAGLLGHDFVDNDVKERLLDDARRGNPSVVIEEQLKARRAEGGAEPTLVMSAAANALGHAVVAAKVTPDEVVETARVLGEREDFIDLIAIASYGAHARRSAAKRAQFHGIARQSDVDYAVLGALGDQVGDAITASDLADAIRVASTETERVITAVTKVARTMMSSDDNESGAVFQPAAMRKTVSKNDRLRAALATISESNQDNHIGVTQLKVALHALAHAANDSSSHPGEVVSDVHETQTDVLVAEVEEARTASAIELRMRRRAREDFYGAKRFASTNDVHRNVVEWLAEYGDENKLASTELVLAAKRLASNPNVAEDLIAKTIKRASVTVTDEKVMTKRITCRVEDLGGLDLKDEAFEENFKAKAMEILAQSGYRVDPTTFALTSVSVSDHGDINAEVSTRFSKTFTADSAPQAEPVMADVAEVPPMPSEVEDNHIMTAAARKAREVRRAELRARYAQVPPAAPAAPAPAAADPLGGLPDTGEPGLSSIMGGEGGTDEDVDAMPEPGTKRPWGSICPVCGSDSVAVSNGEGNCKSCGSQLKYTFSVEVVPNNDDDDTGGPGKDEEPADMGLGTEAGLGAATAPAPVGGPPAMPPAGGGMMMQASWETNADVFVRTAKVANFREAELRLPVGFVCPDCGNREASSLHKIKNTTFCNKCRCVSKTEVCASSTPGKIVSKIKWFI